MSTLSNLLDAALSLLFPAQCIGCGKVLTSRQKWVCAECFGSMPTTYFHLDDDNFMADRLRSISPSIVSGAAQFYFVHKSQWRAVIHEIKYRRAWLSARKMGVWYGLDLAQSPSFSGVDLVVPVPLHPSRRLKRRYNQAEMIAEGIAQSMGCPLERHALRRLRNNPSQVTRTRSERWTNVEGLFEVVRPARLEGKHILLVDDVFTTGSTIVACISAIETAIPSSRISVATLAIAHHEVEGGTIS